MALFGRILFSSPRSIAAAAVTLNNQTVQRTFTTYSTKRIPVNRHLRTENEAGSQTAFTPVVVKSIEVEELQRLRLDDENSLILIDVRDLTEISNSSGFIPGCINIPLGSLATALSLNRCEFRKKYRKPMDVDKLVFVCRVGVASALAAEYAAKLGCTNVRFLEGGFEAYMEQFGSKTAV